jgi:hypothetical protein
VVSAADIVRRIFVLLLDHGERVIEIKILFFLQAGRLQAGKKGSGHDAP